MNGLAKVPALAAVVALCLVAGASPRVACAEGEAFNPDPPGARKLSRPSRPLARGTKTGKGKSTSGFLWKTVSLLAILVVVIVFGGKFLKKHAPRLGGGIPTDAMEVLGKRSIERGQLVYLVRLGARILIIGSSNAGLQTLGEVTDPVEIDYLAGLCKPADQPSGIAQGFLALFNRNQHSQSEPTDPATQTDPAPYPEATESFPVSYPATHSAENQRTHVS